MQEGDVTYMVMGGNGNNAESKRGHSETRLGDSRCGNKLTAYTSRQGKKDTEEIQQRVTCTWQSLPSNNLMILGSILGEAPCTKHPQTTEQTGPEFFLQCSPFLTLVFSQRGTLIYQWMMWCTLAGGRHGYTRCLWKSFASISASIPTLK